MNNLDTNFNSPELASSYETTRDVEAVVARIKSLVSGHSRPIVVALDGRSGTGKSTLAKRIAASVGGIYVETDDFWAGGPNDEWDARSSKEKSELAIDWKRLREEVLKPLLIGREASWRPFDFKEGFGLAERVITKGPSRVVVLDGAYSSRPELGDFGLKSFG